MLFAITRGQVSAEAAQTESIVYLAASVQALRAAGLVVVTRDRKERRQAECLVYPTVPWALFEAVVTKTDNARRHIESLLANSGRATPVLVRPNWYF